MGLCPILLLKFHCLLYTTDQKLRESFTICPKLPFSPHPALPAPNLVTYRLTSPCLTSCILSECHAPAIPVNSYISFLLIYKFPKFFPFNVFAFFWVFHDSGPLWDSVRKRKGLPSRRRLSSAMYYLHGRSNPPITQNPFYHLKKTEMILSSGVCSENWRILWTPRCPRGCHTARAQYMVTSIIILLL